jgi:hypothetical protein
MIRGCATGSRKPRPEVIYRDSWLHARRNERGTGSHGDFFDGLTFVGRRGGQDKCRRPTAPVMKSSKAKKSPSVDARALAPN